MAAAPPTAVPPPPRAGLHYGWVILAASTLAVFAALGLARFGYSLVLPAMQTGLGMQNTGAGLLASANLAGYLIFCVVGGALASHFGPRRVVSVALVVIALSLAMTGLSGSFREAAFWRGITGLGSGAANVPAMGLVAGWFAVRRRGLAAGIGVAGSSVGLIVLGPTVPRVMAAYGAEGWRVCWYGFAGLALIVAALAALLLRDRPGDMGLRPVGAAPEEPLAAPPTGGLAWGAVYRSPTVWHLGLVYVAFGFAYIIYMTFFAKALVAEGHYTPKAAGSLFMLMGWCSLFCGLIWGTVSDVIGRKGALIIVYLLHAVAFALFALWPAPTGFTLSAVLFGLSAWSIPAIMAAACSDMLGPRLAPAALGFVTLFMGIGQALGPAVAGAIGDQVHSLLPAMLLAAGVSLLGAVAAAFLRPVVVGDPHANG
jgi:sugar phosphate permease